MSEQAISVETPKKPIGRPSVYSPIVTGKRIGASQLGLSLCIEHIRDEPYRDLG